jgi:hypothetical protein
MKELLYEDDYYTLHKVVLNNVIKTDVLFIETDKITGLVKYIDFMPLWYIRVTKINLII